MGGSGSKSRTQRALSVVTMHIKARSEVYPRTTDILRCPVPDDKVPWSTPFPDYRPVEYTAPSVANKPVWADPDYRNSQQNE